MEFEVNKTNQISDVYRTTSVVYDIEWCHNDIRQTSGFTLSEATVPSFYVEQTFVNGSHYNETIY